MQIVIDIPKERYKWIVNRVEENKNEPTHLPMEYELIANGTPQPKTGYWREVDTNMYACSYCSHCFSIVLEDNSIKQYHYCPNCGCRMVEPQESEGEK